MIPVVQDNRWWVWLSVNIGVFMATLDSSIVNISLPVIARDLLSDVPSTQWVVLSYMIFLAVLLIPAGRLSDLIGRRKVYVLGMLLFTLGSFLCGLSHHIYMLIAMRAVQAIGAAGLMASGPAIITEAFRTSRGKALGLTGTVVSIGTMIGPSLGGWIVDAWGWPWIFWVNIPVGLAASVVSWGLLSRFDSSHFVKRPFDLPGAIFNAVALLSLLLLLTYGMKLPLAHPLNLGLMVIFVTSAAAFVWQERRTQSPLIHFGLFRERLLVNSSVASFLSFIGITFIFFLVPFYLQVVLLYTPAMAGWILITAAVALSIFSPLSGSLSDRIGTRNLAIGGMLVSAAGLVLISLFTQYTSLPWILLGLFVVGMGNGLFHAPNNSQLLGSVSPEYLGMASGLLAIVRTLGMTFAVALVGIIYIQMQAQLSAPAGFMPAFRTVFVLGAFVTVLNAIWIGWYRPRT